MKVKAKFYAEEAREIELEDRAGIKDLLVQLCDTDERYCEILEGSIKSDPSVMAVLGRGQQDPQIVDIEHTSLKDGDVVMLLRAVLGGG